MKKTQLAKAVALTLSGIALAGIANTASASTTMYNTFNYGTAGNPAPNNLMNNIPAFGGVVDSGGVGTDGWTHTVEKNVFGNIQPSSHGSGPGVAGAAPADIAEVPWVGSVGSVAPFSYSGGRVLHWGIGLSGAGDSGTISAADSNKYGFDGGSFYADIDSAKGAWRDLGAEGFTQGWSHDLDIGLLKSDITQDVTLSVAGLDATSAQYGITVYQGMDTTPLASYSHHASWHADKATGGTQAPDNTAGGPVGPSPANPHAASFTGLDSAAIAESIDASGWSANELVFTAEAGEVYTVMLGGYEGGLWGNTIQGYTLDVSTTVVPVPAAVWLFGSALAGMGVVGRRKRQEKA